MLCPHKYGSEDFTAIWSRQFVLPRSNQPMLCAAALLPRRKPRLECCLCKSIKDLWASSLSKQELLITSVSEWRLLWFLLTHQNSFPSQEKEKKVISMETSNSQSHSGLAEAKLVCYLTLTIRADTVKSIFSELVEWFSYKWANEVIFFVICFILTDKQMSNFLFLVV